MVKCLLALVASPSLWHVLNHLPLLFFVHKSGGVRKGNRSNATLRPRSRSPALGRSNICPTHFRRACVGVALVGLCTGQERRRRRRLTQLPWATIGSIIGRVSNKTKKGSLDSGHERNPGWWFLFLFFLIGLPK